MGGTFSVCGDKRGVYRFGWGNLWERIHLGDPGLDGRQNYNGSSGCGVWTGSKLAEDRDMCRALVNAVMNLWVS